MQEPGRQPGVRISILTQVGIASARLRSRHRNRMQVHHVRTSPPPPKLLSQNFGTYSVLNTTHTKGLKKLRIFQPLHPSWIRNTKIDFLSTISRIVAGIEKDPTRSPEVGIFADMFTKIKQIWIV